MQIVWFKRDLRAQDHRALVQAAQQGDVLPLYIVEPELWHQPDASERQWAFVSECLAELRENLAALGQPLVMRFGNVIEVLDQFRQDGLLSALWSHEETGNGWTFARDKAVGAWCRAHGVPWHEIQNHGVQRRLASRNGWANRWDAFMAEALSKPPALKPLSLDPGNFPTNLNLPPDPCPQRQVGGRTAGLERLESFLTSRGRTYRRAMSSPLEGADACSRVSPHLAWGTLSMREVMQATWAQQVQNKTQGVAGGWAGSLRSFSGRLHWHCHFIQKLEDAPRLEFQNMHRAYDGLRPREPDQTRLRAWAAGETGLPFLDACMRSLRATGWLNFRMRAMVMATASYHLWLDWRAPGLELARLFTDYEPGIHWSQVQMQSGTTGINTVRIYNPVKQGQDQDPTGAFTRAWVPELAEIPDAVLQEPWKAENAGRILGNTYPEPIIDHLASAREARDKVWAIRRGRVFPTEAHKIQNKHGSRKSGIQNRGQRVRKSTSPAQLGFNFGEEQS